MWQIFVLKTVGKLLEDCSFQTLSRVHDIILNLDDVQRSNLNAEFGTKTLIEMIQSEYEYRTQCDDCRREANLDPSKKF